jgi:hypothetical protein
VIGEHPGRIDAFGGGLVLADRTAAGDEAIEDHDLTSRAWHDLCRVVGPGGRADRRAAQAHEKADLDKTTVHQCVIFP